MAQASGSSRKARAPALTFENAVGALQGVSWGRMVRTHPYTPLWRELGTSLGVPESMLDIIERFYSSAEDCGSAVIEQWIRTDTRPSWRKLIQALDLIKETRALLALAELGDTRIVDAIRSYAEPLRDSTLTVENVAGVMEKVGELGRVAYWLDVPPSNQVEIMSQHSTERERKCALGEYWMKTDPYASWEKLERVLSVCDEKTALDAVNQYLHPLRGHEHSSQLFEEAMKHGSVNSRDRKLLITGAAGVGKSHALAMILEEDPPSVRQSTPCATKPVRAVSVTKVGMKGEDWERANENEFSLMVADAASSQQIQHGNASMVPDSEVKAMCMAVDTQLMFSSETMHAASPGITSSSISPHVAKRAPTSLELTPFPTQLTGSSLKSFNIDVELAQLMDSPLCSRLRLTEGDWINVMDSGGQLEFLELLPIFMRNTSVALFVLKLSECLSARPAIEYYKQGKPVGKPYHSPLTNEQILQRCMRAVQFQKSQSGDDHCPTMVFIGTHKDLEHTCPEKLREKNRRLKALLPPTLHDNVIYYDQKMEQPIFPVNAKFPGPEERRIAAELRELIRKKSATTQRKIPLQWHSLELLLQRMAKELGQGVIKKAECREAAKQQLQFNDDDSFEEALKFLDQQGIIFYYPKLLPNIIFCNPNVILDKITELVEYRYRLRHGLGDCTLTEGKWRHFRDQGIISIEFLSHFKSHYVPDLFTPTDLLKLFEGLLIIAAVNKEYLMPCLMPCLMPVHTEVPNPAEEVATTSSSSSLSLLVYFPDGGPCLGIFCALIAHLLSVAKWELLLRGSTPVHVSRNSVAFSVPGRYPGRVTITDPFTSHFHVRINVPKHFNLFSKDLCSKFREIIFKAISKVTSQLGYRDIVPQEAFFCPKAGTNCDPSPHPAIVAGDWECLTCTNNPEVGSDLRKEHLVWRAPLTSVSCERLKLSSSGPDVLPPSQLANRELTTSNGASTVQGTLSDHPPLKKLLKFPGKEKVINIPEKIGTKYTEFAAFLLEDDDGAIAEGIAHECHMHDSKRINTEILKQWLQGKGLQPVTWKTLIEVLRDIDLTTLASDIENVLL